MSRKKPAENIPFKLEAFQNILNFYLFNCPVVIKKRKVSVKGDSFEKMNITGSKLTVLLNEMKKSAEYQCISPKESVEDVFRERKKNTSFSDPGFNLIIFIENSDIGKTKTIFYYIRNALAHGDFLIENVCGQRIYTLRSQKGEVVKGLFRLKESTLLSWIDLVYQQPQGQKKTTKNKHKKYKKAS